MLIARPMVAVLARYASRFSVRALDVTVDSSMLWVGAALAVVAAVLLAFVPRLPAANASQGLGLSNGSVRITGSTSRRLRVFAMTQIAASFVLLAGAGMLLKTLLALQATQVERRRGSRFRLEQVSHASPHEGLQRSLYPVSLVCRYPVRSPTRWRLPPRRYSLAGPWQTSRRSTWRVPPTSS